MNVPTAMAATSRRGPAPSGRSPCTNRRTLLRKSRIIYDYRGVRGPQHPASFNHISALGDTIAPLQPRAPRWVDEAVGTGTVQMLTAVVAGAAAMSTETLRA